MQKDQVESAWIVPLSGTSLRGLNLSGSAAGDTIDGTDNPDLIYGGDGSDVINSGGGHDTLFGGAGDADFLDGQAGEDLIYAGAGNEDIVSGGHDNDTIYGGAGDHDTLYGDGGNDVVFDGSGDEDVMYLGPGNDQGFGGPGFGDVLFGGTGNDSLQLIDATPATLGGSLLYGNSGDDQIDGSPYNDALLSGGLGTDLIYGYSGDDRLNVHFGDGAFNELWGGEGADEFNFQADGSSGGDVLIGDWERSETITIDLEAGSPTPHLDSVTYDESSGLSTFQVDASESNNGILRIHVPGNFITEEYFQTVAGAEGEDLVFYNGPGPEPEVDDDFLDGLGPLLIIFLLGAGGFLAYNQGGFF